MVMMPEVRENILASYLLELRKIKEVRKDLDQREKQVRIMIRDIISEYELDGGEPSVPE